MFDVAMPCHSNNKATPKRRIATKCNEAQYATTAEQNVRFSDTFIQQCTTHISANSTRCLFIVHNCICSEQAEAPNIYNTISLTESKSYMRTHTGYCTSICTVCDEQTIVIILIQ